MKLQGILLLSAAALSGCTLDLSSDTDPRAPALTLQNISSAPGKSYRDIDESQLQAGDLLFSSSVGATSFGIRLFSTSSVSHVALYIGEGKVAEAVGSGVQVVPVAEAIKHSDKLFVLRRPDLTPQQTAKIAEFAMAKLGRGYNYTGIVKMMPFMVTKQLCALNPFSRDFRRQCLMGLANSQLDHDIPDPERYFCSQFVIAAFQYSGQPLTTAEAGWVSPADLLHMREGDVHTLVPVKPLRYVGHLSPGIYFKARHSFLR